MRPFLVLFTDTVILIQVTGLENMTHKIQEENKKTCVICSDFNINYLNTHSSTE